MSPSERRALMQRIITHPDAIADLLITLMDRVETLEWVAQQGEVRAHDTLHGIITHQTNYTLKTILEIDLVAATRREHT